ncbi:hypothetical protein [Sphaerochaeta globosa]|uniref:Uncharacterized protein n=1 Tax=Sphaerochaeta globosa (strain ATCC BAA-1886 / DSM 22777 / Buddy) TaxID=158189 RepID=F0RWM6_SPHGB|nr:hypothetical protein [Sphaerochaeta globosa]ADY13657.1 hypothetical protein SpiBuddy_1833 [Sphaerochaeta globosa str. Buddy]
MEILCRKCPNKCKDEGKKGRVLKYCGNAPENMRILEDFRRTENVSSKKSKKTKTAKPIPVESKDVVWNASDWVVERNLKAGA